LKWFATLALQGKFVITVSKSNLITQLSKRDSNIEILKFFLCSSPLFLMTISSWSSGILLFGTFFCVILLINSKKELDSNPKVNSLFRILTICTLAAPLLAILFSSFLRNKYHWAEFDSASRFLLAIAIFRFAIQERINITKYFQYIIPSSLIITLAHQLLFPQPRLWGLDRMSTYFADPLVFGYTSLTFGLISLISINLLSKDRLPIIILKLVGFSIGLYLSIMSGSRTGWLAIPFVISICMNHQELFKEKAGILKIIIFSFIFLIILGLFIFAPNSSKRLLLASQELISYSWSGIAPDTSIGLRITFLRIAFDMFTTHPILGFGDTSKGFISLPAQIFTYASTESLRMAFNSGFHNEVVTNAIRYGAAGLISAALLFITPFIVFIHQLKYGSPIQKANSLIGIIFTTCFFISSFSTEVFDLKYMASFYALTITLLCASAISAGDAKLIQL
jgi:O-antigen ligase